MNTEIEMGIEPELADDDLFAPKNLSWERFAGRLFEEQLYETSNLSRQEAARLLLARLSPQDQEVLKRLFLNDETRKDIEKSMGLSAVQFSLTFLRAKSLIQELSYTQEFDNKAYSTPYSPNALVTAHYLQRLQAPIFMRALEVFGTSERAQDWMEAPNPALGNLAPLAVVLDETKRGEILNVLGRIEHGVLS